jgi:hypothetical protein
MTKIAENKKHNKKTSKTRAWQGKRRTRPQRFSPCNYNKNKNTKTKTTNAQSKKHNLLRSKQATLL